MFHAYYHCLHVDAVILNLRNMTCSIKYKTEESYLVIFLIKEKAASVEAANETKLDY